MVKVLNFGNGSWFHPIGIITGSRRNEGSAKVCQQWFLIFVTCRDASGESPSPSRCAWVCRSIGVIVGER
jgi:hypothetical protein